ncbi:MAG: MATE family efflux transporter [Lachnospiraceae bacterium]|nr:MATE family efflux transporter [Lachnospiraceae bacterium]
MTNQANSQISGFNKSFLSVDLINGPIFKSLLLFAMPFFISNMFQQFYNTADTMIVGHLLGEESLAAIGACTPIYDLLIGFALGFGNGFSIVTARFFGARNKDDFSKAVSGSLVAGLIITLITTITAQLSVYPLLKLLNTPDSIINEANSYISTITLFVFVMFAYNLCSSLLRSIGNSFVPLIFLIISACTNIGLDYLFIGIFGLGIRGAAIATVISQGLSVLLCLVYIFKFCKILIPTKKDFAVGKKIYSELISQGISNALMSCLVSAGSVILQYGINGLGKYTIAGHTTARKLFSFSIMPISSLGYSTTTFISQNRGANKRDRIIKCLKGEYLYIFFASMTIFVLMKLFAPTLVHFVSGSDNSLIIDNGSKYLIYNSPFYIALGIVLTTRSSLQSLGMKILAVISSLIEFVGKIIFVVVFIPKFGYNAVIFCEPAIWCFMAVYLIYTFFNAPYIRNKN